MRQRERRARSTVSLAVDRVASVAVRFRSDGRDRVNPFAQARAVRIRERVRTKRIGSDGDGQHPGDSRCQSE